MKNTKSLNYLLSVLALASTVFATGADRGAGAGPAHAATPGAAASHHAFEPDGSLNITFLSHCIVPDAHAAALGTAGAPGLFDAGEAITESEAADMVGSRAPLVMSDILPKFIFNEDGSIDYAATNAMHPVVTPTQAVPMTTDGHLDVAAINAMAAEERDATLTNLGYVCTFTMRSMTLVLSHCDRNGIDPAGEDVFAAARSLPVVREFCEAFADEEGLGNRTEDLGMSLCDILYGRDPALLERFAEACGAKYAGLTYASPSWTNAPLQDEVRARLGGSA